MITKDAHVQIPRICEYVQLIGKGELRLQMEMFAEKLTWR